MKNFKGTLSWFKRIYALLKIIFWKNNDIVYINSNKKILELDSIKEFISKKSKLLNCQKISTKQNLGFNKSHFARMNFNLFQISRNALKCPNIKYCGFVSTPFSFYDGYILGNTHNYTFLEFDKKNQKVYPVYFKKGYVKQEIKNKITGEEVNVVVNSSYKVFEQNIPNRYSTTFSYNKLIPEYKRVSIKDLNEIYSWLTDVFNYCSEKGVKRINLFLSARQSIGFIAGTSYQSHHPELSVFEFNGTQYSWKLNVKNAKISNIKL